jgi:hypothetical protein
MGQLCSSKVNLVFATMKQTWRCEVVICGRHGCCGEANVIPAMYAPWLDIWGCVFLSLRARCEDTKSAAAGLPERARATAYLGRNRAMRATANAVPSRLRYASVLLWMWSDRSLQDTHEHIRHARSTKKSSHQGHHLLTPPSVEVG